MPNNGNRRRLTRGKKPSPAASADFSKSVLLEKRSLLVLLVFVVWSAVTIRQNTSLGACLSNVVFVVDDNNNLESGQPTTRTISNNNKISSSSSSSHAQEEQQDEELLPSFPFLLNKVLLIDIVWIPKESKVAFLATNPNMFHQDIMLATMQPEKRLFEIDGVSRHEFGSPVDLQEGLEFSFHNGGNTRIVAAHNCTNLKPNGNDIHIERALRIAHCHYDNHKMISSTKTILTTAQQDTLQQQTQLVISYKNHTVARFNIAPSTTTTKHPFVKLNAAASMKFFRPPPSSSPQNNGGNDDFSVSVLIKGVYQYSKFAKEIIDYWYRQGISHVYLGVFPMDGPVQVRYAKALENYTTTGFVSMGGMNKDAPTYQHLTLDGWKVCYIQSALGHAKYFDDMLIVVDLDEIMTSMRPTETSIVEVLRKAPNPQEHCDYRMASSVATSAVSEEELDEANSYTPLLLQEYWPDRCPTGGKAAYDKSIAVLSNCNWVGFHWHGGCRPGTSQKDWLEESQGRLLHFANFWSPRYARSRHERHSSGACNITNEYKTFMESGLSFRNRGSAAIES